MPVNKVRLWPLLAEYSELPEFEGEELTSVNQKGRWDSMPLHIAIHRKRFEEAKVLLDAGADPNAPGEYGERPLQIAVSRKLFDIAEMLLRAGARCELKDNDDMDTWQTAEMFGSEQQLQQIVRKIAQEGVDGTT